MMLDVFPRMFMWYKMKTSGRLPLSEGSLLGKCLLEERMVKLTHTHARTDWRTRSFPSFPTEGTLTEAALPVTVAAIILQALSTDCLLQVSTLLTTSLSTHTYSVCTLTHRRAHCTPTSTHTVHIHTHTRTYGCMCGCAFHPQFALHRLMARTNRNDVLVQTSCSSQEKHTTLCGCECSCKHVHISLMGSAKDKYIIKGETGKKSANTHIHEKN